MILPVHQRLAELRSIQKKRSLNAEEIKEYEQCLDANVALCWKLARLENCFSVAYETKDTDWMHECCAKIEEMQKHYPKRGEL